MKKTNQKGITLIALVITIIVLLILAGVSIAMLSGNNGVLTKATQAQVDNVRGEVCDKINTALNGIFSEMIAVDFDVSDTNIKTAVEKMKKTNGLDSADKGVYYISYDPNATEGKTVINITWQPAKPDDDKYDSESKKYKGPIVGMISFKPEFTAAESDYRLHTATISQDGGGIKNGEGEKNEKGYLIGSEPLTKDVIPETTSP